MKEEKDAGRGGHESLTLEVEQLKLEKDILSDTAKAWEAKLRELLKERTENTVEIKKLGLKISKMEEKEKARVKATEIIANSPKREGPQGKTSKDTVMSPRLAEKNATEETIEGLVLEYTKLSAESQKNSDLHDSIVMDFKTRCEEYEVKIKAQEQNILLLMNKGMEDVVVPVRVGDAKDAKLYVLQAHASQLEKELSEAKAVTNKVRCSDSRSGEFARYLPRTLTHFLKTTYAIPDSSRFSRRSSRLKASGACPRLLSRMPKTTWKWRDFGSKFWDFRRALARKIERLRRSRKKNKSPTKS